MEVIKNIEDISFAIQNLNKIEFEYWKYDISDKLKKVIVGKPKVTPYALVYKKQEFYLIAIKEGNENFYHYRLDRIKNIKQLDEKRTITKTTTEIQEFAESTVEMFGGNKTEIEAICYMYLLDDVFDRFGKNITVINVDDEKFKIIVDANDMGFKLWALRNLDGVEVIKPQSLREEIKKLLQEAIKIYE